MTKPEFPQRPRAHQLDDETCREIEQLLVPHIVERRNGHDYGKDLLVQLVDRSVQPHKVTGKQFSIQAKSSGSRAELSVDVRVTTLNLWLNSIEPVLLIKVFRPETDVARIHGAWIDADLKLNLNRSSPKWRSQDTVRIPLGLELTKEKLGDIERFVQDWRFGRQDASWDPREFASIEKEAQALAADLAGVSSSAGLEGPAATLSSAAKQLKRLSYSVALLGNSRVGKSTLLNRLLGRELSPVQRLPTTAVAMSVSCAETETATVHFLDGATATGEATAAFLSPYMTQQENPDNKKNVAHVDVRLADRMLAGGIALLDLPGFHDANPEIRAVSDAALENADACVYIIDVAPFVSSSFSFTEQHVSRLKALQTDCDRVLLVLSKADLLKKADRAKALEYVTSQLEKYELLGRLAAPPLFVGVSPKLEGGAERNRAPKWLSVDELKEQIWKVLLQDGEIASARAHENLSSIITAHQDLVRAVQARLLNGQRAAELQQRLGTVEAEIERICQMVDVRCRQIAGNSAQRAASAVHSLIAGTEAWIRTIPVDQPLPSSADVRGKLYANAQRLFTAEHQAVGLEVSPVKLDAERRIQTVLEQLPLGKLQQQSLGALQVPEIAPFPLSAIHRGIMGTIGVGVVSWLFGTPLTLAATLFVFVLSAIIDSASARAEDVEKRVTAVQKLGPQIEKQVVDGLLTVLAAFREEVSRKTRERGTYAVHDLKKITSDAGRALTPAQSAELNQLLEQLASLETRLQKLYARVMRATGIPIPSSRAATVE